MRALLLVLLLAGCDTLDVNARAECECGEEHSVSCEVGGKERRNRSGSPMP